MHSLGTYLHLFFWLVTFRRHAEMARQTACKKPLYIRNSDEVALVWRHLHTRSNTQNTGHGQAQFQTSVLQYRPVSSTTQCLPWDDSFSVDQLLRRPLRNPKVYSVTLEVLIGVTANITVFWDVMAFILYQTTRHHIPKTALFIIVFTETYYWTQSSARYVNPVYALTPCKTDTDTNLEYAGRRKSASARVFSWISVWTSHLSNACWNFWNINWKSVENDSQLCILLYFLTRHSYMQLGKNSH
jgi:hypothetical protein